MALLSKEQLTHVDIVLFYRLVYHQLELKASKVMLKVHHKPGVALPRL
jgi:hypothetical protein